MMNNVAQGYRMVAASLSDSVNQPSGVFVGIFAGAGGTLSIDTGDGAQGTTNIGLTVPAGFTPCRGRRVNTTGTAATGLFCCYLD